MGFCGVTESLVATAEARGTGLSRMIANTVNVWVSEPMVGFSRGQWEDALMEGFTDWSNHINVTFRLCSSEAKGIEEFKSRKAAFWRIVNHRFDGPMGILADMQLAYPGVQTMRFDVAERWFHGINMPSGRIPVVQTAKHEGGHGIGLPHTPSGPPAQVMDPTLQVGIPLHETEIGMAAKLYGPAKVTPVAPPPPVTPLGDSLGVELIIGKITEEVAKIERLNFTSGGRKYTANGQAKRVKDSQIVTGGLE
jgi:predicted secreted protein